MVDVQELRSAGPQRHVPLLLILFVGSGCSALIYEIVWLQLLQLVIGSSAVSLGVLLGTFMGGMCLGSIALPYLISQRWHPLRVYALLELGIGLLGLLLLMVIPHVSRLYWSHVGHGTQNLLIRAAVCALCLLPPTVLMGATLPAVARWMESTRQGMSKLGFFYGSNIAGAVFGCLLAGFYLLRVHDLVIATYVAVLINTAVAVVSLAVAMAAPYRPTETAHPTRAPEAQQGSWTVYLSIALSGMCALGAEVVWTRELSLLLGASVYTFSIILAVFLVGLGLGSALGAAWSRSLIRPRMALGCCQCLVTGAVTWTAYQLALSLPHWPIDTTLPTSPWLNFQLDIVRCVWAILPAAVLWGASFPLALASVAAPGLDPGRLVGRVYAANTIGAIAGAVGFSMLIIAWLGTQGANQLLIGLSVISALILFVPMLGRIRSEDSSAANGGIGGAGPSPGLRRAASLSIAASVAASLLILLVPEAPRGLVAFGRNLPTWTDLPEIIYLGEGMNASVAVSEFDDGTRNFHVSGKVVASTELQDMRLQRMLGHVPALLHDDPRTVLVVGCGAGVTAGSFVWHPTVERIVICEIEPLIPPAANKYFAEANDHLLDDQRVEVVYDDARHYIATTQNQFDIITSDPIHPWVKGAAALYSQEYFQLCRQRLNPGGIVTQWVPLYETNLEAVQSELATFFRVFPQGILWGNDIDGEGYDIVVMGQVETPTIDADLLQAKLDREEYRRVVESLDDCQLGSALSLLATYAGRGLDLEPWLERAEITHDRNLRLQYLAGLGLNRYDSDLIYQSLLAFRRYPTDLFAANGIRGRALRQVIERSDPSE